MADGFVFGFSKLDVMFGRTDADARRAPVRATSRQAAASGSCRRPCGRIDPVARRVETDAGPLDADVLVVALGADLDPEATPGLVEARPRVLHRRPAPSPRARCSTRFAGGRVIVGGDVDAVQVPAGPERDGAARARPPARRAGCCDRSTVSLVMPLRRRRSRRRPQASDGAARRRSPSAASTGTRRAWSASWTRSTQGREAGRRRRAAVRPVPRRPGPPRAGGRGRARA